MSTRSKMPAQRRCKLSLSRAHIRILIVLLIGGLGIGFGSWVLAAPASQAPAGPVCTVDDDGPADYATIQDAVDDTSCNTINVAEGTYVESVVVSRSVNIRGAGVYNTNVDGNFSNRVFLIGNPDAEVGLTQMWIGYGDAGDEEGGGIYNKGRLTLYNVTVAHNDAYEGGGIFNTGWLTLTDSLIHSNYADNDGGGLYNYLSGDDFYQGLWVTATIANSQISNNDTFAGDGGGIYHMGTLTMIGSEIDNNVCAAGYGGVGGGMRIHWTSGPVTIEDSVIRNNYADNAGAISAEAVLTADEPITIKNSQILSNTAQDFGGGIDVSRSMTLSHSTVQGNSASVGGGILVGNLFDNVEVNIVDTDIANNTPSGINVGALGITQEPVEVKIYASTIHHNDGVGVENFVTLGTALIRNSEVSNNDSDGIHDRGELTLVQSLVSNNVEQGIDGRDVTARYSTVRDNGSHGIRAYGHLKVIFSTVSGNTAYCGGGVNGYKGPGATSGAMVEVRSSTITGNSATTSGGGICIERESELLLNNSTVSGNTADEDGGGIALVGPTAIGSLDHATIADNTADQDGDHIGDGGGIYVSSSSTFSVARSIVAINRDNSQFGVEKDPDCHGEFVATGLNLIGAYDGFNCTGFGGALQLTGPENTPLDPQLSPLADNGGPTLTHAPDPASPAVDYQFATSCPLDVDQRGVDRPQGDGNGDLDLECDLGAYEIGTCPAPVQPTLSITRSEDDIQLSWTDDPANREYVFYRNTDPFNPFANLISVTVPFVTRTDYGAVGNVLMNYFYRVAGDNACGQRSALSNKTGEFDFGITPGGNRLRLTMIALPLEGDDLPTTADEVAAYIDPEGSIRAVAKWRPLTGSFLVRRVGAPFGTPDFAVAPGDTLVIGADSTAPDSFAWVGGVPARRTITNTLHPLAANTIIVPLDQSGHFTPTALGLGADIGGVLAVARWNRNTQRWVIRTASVGTNFPIFPGYPYVVLTDNSAPPSWP
jgi:hypothetical protein